MNNDNSFSSYILAELEKFIPFVTSDGNKDYAVNLIALIVGIIWVYCGVKIFIDIRKRYELPQIYQLIVLVLGVITGPFGLLVYSLIKPQYSKEELEFIKTEHKFYFHQASKVLECDHCGNFVGADQIYCTDCGAQNRFKCKQCDALNTKSDRFCGECGILINSNPTDRPMPTSQILQDESSPKEKMSKYSQDLKNGFKKVLDFSGNLKDNFRSETKGEPKTVIPKDTVVYAEKLEKNTTKEANNSNKKKKKHRKNR